MCHCGLKEQKGYVEHVPQEPYPCEILGPGKKNRENGIHPLQPEPIQCGLQIGALVYDARDNQLARAARASGLETCGAA